MPWCYRKRLVWFYISGFLFLSAICCRLASGADSLTDSLEVAVRLDKREWMIGDRITITAVIRNMSPERLTFSPMVSFYPIADLRMFTNDETPLDSLIKIHIQMSHPTRANFVNLNPGQEITRTFEATLRETVQDFQTRGYPMLQGLFLDFGNSAITMPGRGKYRLRFQREQSQQLSEEQEKQFGLDNIWHGKLVSDPVDIVVR